MAFFRKNKTSTTDIPELQEYYASQKSENTFVAWALALGSLLVTAAVLVGLFAGGRWIYRTVTKDDTTTTTSVDTSQTSSGSSTTETSPPEDNTAVVENNPTTTVPDTNSNIGSRVAREVSPSQTPETNQTAVAAVTEIPNTGPGSIGVLFAVVLIGGYALHRSLLVRKN